MAISDFEAVIGLEVHAQIATKTKMFCACSADSFDKEANINTCPICMAFPGQLPVINKEAVNKGIKAALALNCKVANFSKFDRKNYFYPDLPKGYQISQFDQPIAERGFLEIEVDCEKKVINITRLHLEDDAGKLTHTDNGTLIDFNRCGEPLMEIVSDPDIRSAREAQEYAKELQSILRYCGASYADMEKGMMRFDASVSIRKKGETILNPRAEIKNLNSFKSLEAAINYEIQRQCNLFEEGNPVSVNQTVGWNDLKQKTYFMRNKEGADDYRYFPEPNLPPLIISNEEIEAIKKEVPEMPAMKYARYIEELGISQAEAYLVSHDLALATYFDKVYDVCKDGKKTSSFINTVILSKLKKDGISLEQLKITPESLGKLITLINDSKINMNVGKNVVFEEMYLNGGDPEKIIEEKGLSKVSNVGELEEICKKIVDENQQSVADYKAGKKNAYFFIVGQVMKATKGQADGQLVNQILEKLINS